MRQKPELFNDVYTQIVRDLNFWIDLQEISSAYEPICDLIAHSESKDATLSIAFVKFIQVGLVLYASLEEKFRPHISETYLVYFSRLDLDLLCLYFACNLSCNIGLLTEHAKSRIGVKLTNLCASIGSSERESFATLDEFKLFRAQRGKYAMAAKDEKRSKFKNIASRLAILRPSSANTEGMFSSLKYIQTDRKSRMNIKTLEDL